MEELNRRLHNGAATSSKDLIRLVEGRDGRAVEAVLFHPSGRFLISGDSKSVVRVWDLEHPKQESVASRQTNHEYGIGSLAVSPDGTQLASAGLYDGLIKIYHLQAEARLSEETPFQELVGHTASRKGSSGVYSLAFSPDGTRLASAGMDKTIRVWKKNQKKFSADPQVLSGHRGVVMAVVFHPQRNGLLISGGSDDTIRFWDLANRQSWSEITVGVDGVFSLAVSPSGEFLAAGGAKGRIRVWNIKDIASSKIVMDLKDSTTGIKALAFSQDGRSLASGGSDGVVRVWEIPFDRLKQSLIGHRYLVRSVAFSPDGKQLASAGGDGTVCLWKISPSAGLEETADLEAAELQLLEEVGSNWEHQLREKGQVNDKAVRLALGQDIYSNKIMPVPLHGRVMAVLPAVRVAKAQNVYLLQDGALKKVGRHGVWKGPDEALFIERWVMGEAPPDQLIPAFKEGQYDALERWAAGKRREEEVQEYRQFLEKIGRDVKNHYDSEQRELDKREPSASDWEKWLKEQGKTPSDGQSEPLNLKVLKQQLSSWVTRGLREGPLLPNSLVLNDLANEVGIDVTGLSHPAVYWIPVKSEMGLLPLVPDPRDLPREMRPPKRYVARIDLNAAAEQVKKQHPEMAALPAARTAITFLRELLSQSPENIQQRLRTGVQTAEGILKKPDSSGKTPEDRIQLLSEGPRAKEIQQMVVAVGDLSRRQTVLDARIGGVVADLKLAASGGRIPAARATEIVQPLTEAVLDWPKVRVEVEHLLQLISAEGGIVQEGFADESSLLGVLGSIRTHAIQEMLSNLACQVSPEALHASYYDAMRLGLLAQLQGFDERLASAAGSNEKLGPLATEAVQWILRVRTLELEAALTDTLRDAADDVPLNRRMGDRNPTGNWLLFLDANGQPRLLVTGSGGQAETGHFASRFLTHHVREWMRPADRAVALIVPSFSGAPNIEQIQQFLEEGPRLQRMVGPAVRVLLGAAAEDGTLRLYQPTSLTDSPDWRQMYERVRVEYLLLLEIMTGVQEKVRQKPKPQAGWAQLPGSQRAVAQQKWNEFVRVVQTVDAILEGELERAFSGRGTTEAKAIAAALMGDIQNRFPDTMKEIKGLSFSGKTQDLDSKQAVKLVSQFLAQAFSYVSETSGAALVEDLGFFAPFHADWLADAGPLRPDSRGAQADADKAVVLAQMKKALKEVAEETAWGSGVIGFLLLEEGQRPRLFVQEARALEGTYKPGDVIVVLYPSWTGAANIEQMGSFSRLTQRPFAGSGRVWLGTMTPEGVVRLFEPRVDADDPERFQKAIRTEMAPYQQGKDAIQRELSVVPGLPRGKKLTGSRLADLTDQVARSLTKQMGARLPSHAKEKAIHRVSADIHAREKWIRDLAGRLPELLKESVGKFHDPQTATRVIDSTQTRFNAQWKELQTTKDPEQLYQKEKNLALRCLTTASEYKAAAWLADPQWFTQRVATGFTEPSPPQVALPAQGPSEQQGAAAKDPAEKLIRQAIDHKLITPDQEGALSKFIQEIWLPSNPPHRHFPQLVKDWLAHQEGMKRKRQEAEATVGERELEVGHLLDLVWDQESVWATQGIDEAAQRLSQVMPQMAEFEGLHRRLEQANQRLSQTRQVLEQVRRLETVPPDQKEQIQEALTVSTAVTAPNEKAAARLAQASEALAGRFAAGVIEEVETTPPGSEAALLESVTQAMQVVEKYQTVVSRLQPVHADLKAKVEKAQKEAEARVRLEKAKADVDARESERKKRKDALHRTDVTAREIAQALLDLPQFQELREKSRPTTRFLEQVASTGEMGNGWSKVKDYAQRQLERVEVRASGVLNVFYTAILNIEAASKKPHQDSGLEESAVEQLRTRLAENAGIPWADLTGGNNRLPRRIRGRLIPDQEIPQFLEDRQIPERLRDILSKASLFSSNDLVIPEIAGVMETAVDETKKPPFHLSRVIFRSPANRSVIEEAKTAEAIFYYPKNVVGRAPAVVIPAFGVTDYFATTLAMYFVSQGVAAMVVGLPLYELRAPPAWEQGEKPLDSAQRWIEIVKGNPQASPEERVQRFADFTEQSLLDVMTAVSWLRRYNGVDPDRISLAGHSMPAMIAHMAFHLDARLWGLVSFSPVVDMATLIWWADRYEPLEKTLEGYGITQEQFREGLSYLDPRKIARSTGNGRSARILMVPIAQDDVVPPEEFDQLLKAEGSPGIPNPPVRLPSGWKLPHLSGWLAGLHQTLPMALKLIAAENPVSPEEEPAASSEPANVVVSEPKEGETVRSYLRRVIPEVWQATRDSSDGFGEIRFSLSGVVHQDYSVGVAVVPAQISPFEEQLADTGLLDKAAVGRIRLAQIGTQFTTHGSRVQYVVFQLSNAGMEEADKLRGQFAEFIAEVQNRFSKFYPKVPITSESGNPAHPFGVLYRIARWQLPEAKAMVQKSRFRDAAAMIEISHRWLKEQEETIQEIREENPNLEQQRHRLQLPIGQVSNYLEWIPQLENGLREWEGRFKASYTFRPQEPDILTLNRKMELFVADTYRRFMEFHGDALTELKEITDEWNRRIASPMSSFETDVLENRMNRISSRIGFIQAVAESILPRLQKQIRSADFSGALENVAGAVHFAQGHQQDVEMILGRTPDLRERQEVELMVPFEEVSVYVLWVDSLVEELRQLETSLMNFSSAGLEEGSSGRALVLLQKVVSNDRYQREPIIFLRDAQQLFEGLQATPLYQDREDFRKAVDALVEQENRLRETRRSYRKLEEQIIHSGTHTVNYRKGYSVAERVTHKTVSKDGLTALHKELKGFQDNWRQLLINSRNWVPKLASWSRLKAPMMEQIVAEGRPIALLADPALFQMTLQQRAEIQAYLTRSGLSYPAITLEFVSAEQVTGKMLAGWSEHNFRVLHLVGLAPKTGVLVDTVYLQRPDPAQPITHEQAPVVLTAALAEWQRRRTPDPQIIRLDITHLLKMDLGRLRYDEIWQLLAAREDA